MKKKKLNKLDLDLYYDKLENGLEVYVVPIQKFNSIYATFTTKYGSKDNEFIPINEDKMIKVPDGIAHFLEHKLFEQESDIDPFTFFDERGVDSNAYTNVAQTTYLFDGFDFFEESLNFLLDFVQSPYFTDENVKKEMGIIEQEINMYQDKPDSYLYEKALFNSIVKNPIRIPIAGTVKSINQITKEYLYKCYNTFYHPSNMFVVVTGNISPDEVYKIIEENQKQKQFPKMTKKVKTKEYKEPNEVFKEEEIIDMDLSIPKLAHCYKLNISHLNIPKRMIIDYISIYIGVKFGETSIFIEKLKNLEMINKGLMFNNIDLKSHILIMTMIDTLKPNELVKEIKEEIIKFDVSESDFERKKKVFINYLITMGDSIYSINRQITDDLIIEGKIIDNYYDEIQSLNYKDFKRVITSLDFSHNNYIIMRKK